VKRPREDLFFQQPSSALRKLSKQLEALPPGLVLDAPCGLGRNALFLRYLGRTVVCADNDSTSLQAIVQLESLLKRQNGYTTGVESKSRVTRHLLPVCLDLRSEGWPFSPAIFSGIVNVHFVHPPLFKMFLLSLRPGGYLYCETFGGHGMNYIDLPQTESWKSLLENWLDFELYQEKSVGPPHQGAVSVKFFGRKRNQCPDIERLVINEPRRL
jgi:SAM-dependent methyltransferase